VDDLGSTRVVLAPDDSKLQRVGELVEKRAAKSIIGKPYSYIPTGEKVHKLMTGATVHVAGEDTGVDAVSRFFGAPAFEGMVRKRFHELYTETQLQKLEGAINQVVDFLGVSALDKGRILKAANVGKLARVARQVSEPPETEK
jgi:ABC-type hemin transport system substrate-binding protein